MNKLAFMKTMSDGRMFPPCSAAVKAAEHATSTVGGRKSVQSTEPLLSHCSKP